MSSFADFQNEIYLAGLSGAVPDLPTSAAGLQQRAREQLSARSYEYVAGSASAERTAAANTAAFERYRLLPRMWRGTTAPDGRDLSVEVLGTELAAPVLTAPIGVLELLREHGETLVAEATKELGVGMVLSTAASTAMEDVGAAAGQWWYQLYWPADHDLARSLVERAAAAGARAIVVTADTPGMGWRPRDLDLGHLPFLQGKGMANYLSDPVFRAKLATPPEESEAAMQMAVLTWVSQFGNHTLRPADLARLRGWTDLPIAVKGVLHPADARDLVDSGADGIVVSNHGGRQVDGSIAALDALPEVVAAVGDRADVLFDSGVRTGSDVMIALALGAKAVLYGRPWAYGLGLAGRDGVRHALRVLLADLDASMGLSGYARPADLDRTALWTAH
jgi:isopentenyl diphosphate isomerase/L-lactate dehydrogenase-like FMN-dependent dehydrogenase